MQSYFLEKRRLSFWRGRNGILFMRLKDGGNVSYFNENIKILKSKGKFDMNIFCMKTIKKAERPSEKIARARVPTSH